ncbi:hypothetical protein ACEPAG_5449 [Sanghuangporus baumii]
MLPRLGALPTIKRAPLAFRIRSQQAAFNLHTSSLVQPRSTSSILAPALSHVSPCCRNKFLPLLRVGAVRGVASSVSNRPGSQTPSHAATNIKEEVGNTASSVARSIAGANVTVDYVKPIKPEDDSFIGVTSAVAKSVPKPAFIFGLLGGVPYIATSATVVYLARQAGIAAAGFSTNIDPGVALTILDQALSIQVTYGAVMLSFLGALHWGMEFAEYGGQKGYSRLLLGAAPVIWGWSTLALDPTYALITQWVGFTGLWWADLKATEAGWAPRWYSQYRFYLSILVGTCIIGSLAGTSYFGPVAGHGFETHDLDDLRAQRKKQVVEGTGKVGGEIEALPNSAANSYVTLKKRSEEKEKGDDGKSGDNK